MFQSTGELLIRHKENTVFRKSLWRYSDGSQIDVMLVHLHNNDPKHHCPARVASDY